MLSVSFSPLNIALTPICHQNSSIPKCTWRTCAGKHRYGKRLESDNLLIDIKWTVRGCDTLVPLIIMPDGTQFSKFDSDKKEWAVYMTIGDVCSKISQMPTVRSVVMVTLLTISIKTCNISQQWLDTQRQTHHEVLNEGLSWILQPPTFPHNPRTESGYNNIICADGNLRHCTPVLAAWLADCPEYSNLHAPMQHVWFWCECPKKEVGDYVPPDNQHPWWDHKVWRAFSHANPSASNAKLSSRHVHPGFTMCQHIPCIIRELRQPDLLHTMPISILDHLQKWIFHFMNQHTPLDKYNAIRLSVPCDHDLTPEHKLNEEVSQWNGKEMKEVSQYLLGVVTQTLRGGSPALHPIFNHSIEYTQALLEINRYAQ